MIQDCKQIRVKCLNEDDFLIVDNDKINTTQEAQDLLDYYVAEGYTVYDVSTTNSLDVSVVGGNIVCVWKTKDPFGAYEIKSEYFAGCLDIVILGVKIDGSDNVTDYNLEVVFKINSIGIAALPFIFMAIYPIIQSGSYRSKTINSVTGLSVMKSKVYNRMKALTINSDRLLSTYIYNCGLLNIVNGETFTTCDVLNDMAIGGAVKTTLPRTNYIYKIIGNFMYSGTYDSTLISKIDVKTMTVVATLDVERHVSVMEENGGKLYLGSVSESTLLTIVDLSDFTVEDDVDVGVYIGAMIALGDYVYIGTYDENKIRRIDKTNTVTDLALSGRCDQLCSDGVYIYAGSYRVSAYSDIYKIEVAGFTVSDTIARGTGGISGIMGSLFTDGEYIYTSEYSAGIYKIKISDGTQEIIPDLGSTYMIFYCDGFNLYLFADTTKKVYRYDIALGAFYLIFHTEEFYGLNIAEYDGKYFYFNQYGTADVVKYPFTMAEVMFNFATLYIPDLDIVKTQDYKYLTCDLKVRYYIPPDANVENTRLFYIIGFVAGAAVDRSLKKFSGKRYWVHQRDDAMTILMTTGSEKKIINLAMFNNDGSTPYDFRSEFPADENMIIIAENGADVQYFLWYNEELKPTIYSNPNPATTYTVTGVVQLWKRRQTEIDLVSLHNSPDADMTGSLEWDNVDNEILNG